MGEDLEAQQNTERAIELGVDRALLESAIEEAKSTSYYLTPLEERIRLVLSLQEQGLIEGGVIRTDYFNFGSGKIDSLEIRGRVSAGTLDDEPKRKQLLIRLSEELRAKGLTTDRGDYEKSEDIEMIVVKLSDATENRCFAEFFVLPGKESIVEAAPQPG